MRLTINAIGNHSGGGRTVLEGYLRAWQASGSPELTVFVSTAEVRSWVAAAAPGARILGCPVGRSAVARLWAQERLLGPRVTAAGADVLLSTNLLVGRCPVPQLVLHQNLLLFEAARGARSRWMGVLARRAVRRAAANVFISDTLRHAALRVATPASDRNVTIYNGVDEAVVDRAPTVERSDDEPGLLAITADLPHKRNDVLVRVLARLVSDPTEVRWRLWLAADGPLAHERELATALGVADRIDWLGVVDRAGLDRLYRRAACLLFPATHEGFGLPPLEAMARRCPVVAAAAAALPEVIGEAGCLVPPDDIDGFAAAVRQVWQDGRERARLVQRGLERVRAFRWTESAARLARLAQEVSGGS